MSEIVLRIPSQVLRELLQRAEVQETPVPSHEPGPGPGDDEPRAWTDNQRRYIYRLLSQMGYQGDDARNYVRTALRLRGDDTPTKSEASKLIERLKEEAPGNGKGGRRARDS